MLTVLRNILCSVNKFNQEEVKMQQPQILPYFCFGHESINLGSFCDVKVIANPFS